MIITIPTLTLISAAYQGVGLFDFSPLRFGPKLWLDGADSSTITESGGTVSQWDDKSGQGNNASQDTGTKQPALLDSGLVFDGIDDFLDLAGSTGLDIDSNVSIFIAGTVDATATLGYFLARNGANSAEVQYAALYNSSPNAVEYYLENGNRDRGLAIKKGVTQVHSLTYDKVNAEVFLDGQTDGSSPFNATLTSRPNMFIGARSNSVDGSLQAIFLKGTIFEIMIFDKVLPVVDRQLLEEYLKDKWVPVPIQLNAEIWFDASDTNSITESSGSVSQWDDKSGNGNHATQGTSTNQPTTGNETLNGLNVISGDGDDIMTFPCSINPLNPIYVFQVTKFTASTDIIEDFTGTSIRIVVANNVIGRDSGSGIAVKNVTSTTLNTAVMCSSFHINDDANEFTKREDGVQLYNDTVGTDFTTGTFTTGYLFDDSTGGNAINGGYIAEYLVFNPAVKFTDSEIAKIETYLYDKWIPLPIQYQASLWLDAFDSNTITESGGLVSQWSDKSGNGNHAVQASGTRQPVYDGSTKITFDGVDDFFEMTASLKSMFFVVRNASGSNEGTTACSLIGRNDSTSYVFLRQALADYSISLNGVALSNTGDASINESYLIPGTGLGTDIAIPGYVPFPERDQADIIYFQLDSAVDWQVIASFNNAYFADLEIHEIIGFDRSLSAKERTKIRDYLSRKWVN